MGERERQSDRERKPRGEMSWWMLQLQIHEASSSIQRDNALLTPN